MRRSLLLLAIGTAVVASSASTAEAFGWRRGGGCASGTCGMSYAAAPSKAPQQAAATPATEVQEQVANVAPQEEASPSDATAAAASSAPARTQTVSYNNGSRGRFFRLRRR